MGDVAKNLLTERGADAQEHLGEVLQYVVSDSIRGAIQGLFEATGLDVPVKPVCDAPEWPHNLADVADEELGEHMAYWVSMVAYAAFYVALYDADRKSLGRARDRKFSIALVDSYGKNAIVAKAKAEYAPEVAEADEVQMAAEARYKVLQAVLQGAEQKYQAVSREITRRTSQRERRME